MLQTSPDPIPTRNSQHHLDYYESVLSASGKTSGPKNMVSFLDLVCIFLSLHVHVQVVLCFVFLNLLQAPKLKMSKYLKKKQQQAIKILFFI